MVRSVPFHDACRGGARPEGGVGGVDRRLARAAIVGVDREAPGQVPGTRRLLRNGAGPPDPPASHLQIVRSRGPENRRLGPRRLPGLVLLHERLHRLPGAGRGQRPLRPGARRHGLLRPLGKRACDAAGRGLSQAEHLEVRRLRKVHPVSLPLPRDAELRCLASRARRSCGFSKGASPTRWRSRG